MLLAGILALSASMTQSNDPVEPPAPAPDRLAVTLPQDADALLEGGGSEGRMLVLMRRVDSGARGTPLDAPFFEHPQPMYGRPVSALAAGATIVMEPDAETLSFPASMSALSGRFEMQAVFDRDRAERGFTAPGNLVSELTEVDLDPDRPDEVTLRLSRRLPPEAALPTDAGVIWEELRSERLSRALGRDTVMRAGVVLPRGYHDIDWPRRQWPVIYVIPGFGGRHTMATQYVRLVATDRAQLVAPQVIWVVLDPDTALGHHLFADGDIHGPRATALVEEFIPYLESKYRIVPKPEARLVTGHSSGGWSALWLALDRPETFGACFASAPDPVDFSAFQVSDLYRDASIFVDEDAHPRPSYRQPIGPEYERVLMTAAQETAMERVLAPDGTSGQQWDAWAAVFGRKNAAGTGVTRMFDAETGAIDREVVERDWSRYDIARRLDRSWQTLGPIMLERVRVLCGDRDNFYLERAVTKLRDLVERRRTELPTTDPPSEAPGYIELVRGATHGSLPSLALLRWHTEMKQHLKRYGLD